MKKIKKTFQALKELLKNPWLLNKIVNDDKVWADYIIKTHKRSPALNNVDLSSFLTGSSETLETFGFLGGGSLVTDLILLKALSKKIRNCSYFEIGTWRGESVANVADTGADCYTLNLSKEELLKLNLGAEYANLHGFFSGNQQNITYLYGNSKTFDFASLNKKFDLIFIDGNHHYEFVKNDTEKVFQHLVHEKSIVVWHDYAYTPEMVRPEVMAGILDGIPRLFRHQIYHVSNTMCAIFIREKINNQPFKIPVVPDKRFRVSVELNKNITTNGKIA